jgi:hypothetical protein
MSLPLRTPFVVAAASTGLLAMCARPFRPERAVAKA